MKRHRLRQSHSPISLDPIPLVRLWILRMLVPLGVHSDFIQRNGFSDDTLARMLKLDQLDNGESDFSESTARNELRKLHEAAELQHTKHKLPRILKANLDQMGSLIGLNNDSKIILSFIVLLKEDAWLDAAASIVGSMSTLKTMRALSLILDLPERNVRSALASSAPLAQSGLLQIDHGGSYSLLSKFNLLSSDFADLMVSVGGNLMRLLQSAVRPSSSCELGLSDFKHISKSVGMLQTYIGQALTTKRKGVNVLLYGKPGTGKNQLAKLIAKEVGCELVEVASEDSDGDAIDGERRLRALRAAQSMFANHPTLIMFDEIEDAFNDTSSNFGWKSVGQTRKAWVNRMLEDNPVPAFWLTNSVACLDPAFVRRFDMVIELILPTQQQRKAIIEKACDGMLDTISIDRLAICKQISPAVVAKAAAVVKSIQGKIDPSEAGPTVERLIQNTLKAQSARQVKSVTVQHLPETYDPAFINADLDLTAVARGLAHGKAGRLCLYGPPGTGKTAYGRWLANELKLPLLMKRASDLLSCWLGETEQNIAEAFSEAQREGAVLLIDEVDSFLQDRRAARQGWEVSQVNEMLTQMESFDGVFIASTNLMTGLDQASLRRFDIKSKFDFLTCEQAWELLTRHCAAQRLPPPAPELRRDMRALLNLTPGDFAVAVRQSRFRSTPSPRAFVAILEAECALKERGTAKLGFV